VNVTAVLQLGMGRVVPHVDSVVKMGAVVVRDSVTLTTTVVGGKVTV